MATDLELKILQMNPNPSWTKKRLLICEVNLTRKRKAVAQHEGSRPYLDYAVLCRTATVR